MAGEKYWACSTTRLVVSQASQIWRISCRNTPNLLFFSGSCLITEVIKQLYSNDVIGTNDTSARRGLKDKFTTSRESTGTNYRRMGMFV
jgi:hypothetical protein